jgi:pyrroloquinoline quinone biosynthesis protein D
MAAMTGAAVPALPRGVKLRFDKARDRWVLLAPERVLMPDDIAVEILKRCDGKTTLDGIVEDLAAAFSADPAQVEGDVRTFLQDLADKGMRLRPSQSCRRILVCVAREANAGPGFAEAHSVQSLLPT